MAFLKQFYKNALPLTHVQHQNGTRLLEVSELAVRYNGRPRWKTSPSRSTRAKAGGGRAERRGQEHAVQGDRRGAVTGTWRGAICRAQPGRPYLHRLPAAAQPGGLELPGQRGRRGHDGAHRQAGSAALAATEAIGSSCASAWSRLVWRTWPDGRSASFPAGSSSACSSPAPWPRKPS